MKAKTNFTKKDFLFTLGCITFLLANIAAIGAGGIGFIVNPDNNPSGGRF